VTRVLWLIKGIGPGGAERLLIEHAAVRDRGRYDCEVAFLLSWKRHLEAQFEALDVTTHCLDVEREVDARWVPRFLDLAHDGEFDVVHAHSPAVAAVARPALRSFRPARRPAFVYTEHNQWSSYHPTTRAANAATYPMNDAAIAVSSDVRDSIAPRYHDDVDIVVHGVDTERVRGQLASRDDVRAELGVHDGEALAITVANLRAHKNYPGLLATAKIVIDRGVPVRFAAAGQGPLEAEIAFQHATLGLGDRFQLLGYRDDTTRLIAGADVFVLASWHEGLPVTVMDALTLGVPVVAPAVGGLPEVITNGVNGVLVAAGNPVALADGIEEALRRRAELASSAAATGEQFSSARSVSRIEAMYARVAAR
jgi:glycosyltransferase involved in cell wall biosynthesis